MKQAHPISLEHPRKAHAFFKMSVLVIIIIYSHVRGVGRRLSIVISDDHLQSFSDTQVLVTGRCQHVPIVETLLDRAVGGNQSWCVAFARVVLL